MIIRAVRNYNQSMCVATCPDLTLDVLALNFYNNSIQFSPSSVYPNTSVPFYLETALRENSKLSHGSEVWGKIFTCARAHTHTFIRLGRYCDWVL